MDNICCINNSIITKRNKNTSKIVFAKIKKNE